MFSLFLIIYNEHFKRLFFTINLPLLTSNQISIYRKLNLSSTHSIYLVFKPLEMQKRLKQTKVYYKLFLLWMERNDPQTFKIDSCKKNPFFPVCMSLVQLASMNVFILCDNWKTLPYINFIVTLNFFNPPCCCFLSSQCFEISPYFMCYLHNDGTMLIPRFQNRSH